MGPRRSVRREDVVTLLPGRKWRSVLTIAGSDPTGGAGMQMDMKTFHDRGVLGLSVVTVVTAQNTRKFFEAHPVPDTLLESQLACIRDEFPMDAIKIGALTNIGQIETIAHFLSTLEVCPPVVLDPILGPTTQGTFLGPELLPCLVEHLFPLITVATPNRKEATILSGIPSYNKESIAQWAKHLPCSVLVTGGDGPEDGIEDILYRKDLSPCRWTGPKIGTMSIHGTGCALSSCIAANLAQGSPIEKACMGGILYVRKLAQNALTVEGAPQRILTPGMTLDPTDTD